MQFACNFCVNLSDNVWFYTVLCYFEQTSAQEEQVAVVVFVWGLHFWTLSMGVSVVVVVWGLSLGFFVGGRNGCWWGSYFVCVILLLFRRDSSNFVWLSATCCDFVSVWLILYYFDPIRVLSSDLVVVLWDFVRFTCDFRVNMSDFFSILKFFFVFVILSKTMHENILMLWCSYLYKACIYNYFVGATDCCVRDFCEIVLSAISSSFGQLCATCCLYRVCV